MYQRDGEQNPAQRLLCPVRSHPRGHLAGISGPQRCPQLWWHWDSPEGTMPRVWGRFWGCFGAQPGL